MEPFQSRSKVLEEEVTKLMSELRVSEQKAADAKQKQEDAQVTKKKAEDRLKKKKEEIAEERLMIEDGFEKAKVLYGHLFADHQLDFDYASAWHKLENGVLVPSSNDEDEDRATAEDHPKD